MSRLGDSPAPTVQLQECPRAIMTPANVLFNHEPSPTAEMSLILLPESLPYNTTPYTVPDSEQRTTWVYRHEAAYPEVVRSMADECELYLYRGMMSWKVSMAFRPQFLRSLHLTLGWTFSTLVLNEEKWFFTIARSKVVWRPARLTVDSILSATLPGLRHVPLCPPMAANSARAWQGPNLQM
ncbi:hypothetical protein F4604DRAFT_1686622 [Suillus subluteus]|nr:hypothetical protein F4604DRAFT_1686622 [Suillus subluteus]